MKISTKGRYGLRALIYLSLHANEGQISLISIANHNQISIHYLEQVFSTLKKAGIVKSVKGAQGGYILGDAPKNITVSQIITSLEGDYTIAREEIDDLSEFRYISLTIQTKLWDRINKDMEHILSNTTLEDLVSEYVSLSQSGNDMYYI